MPKAYPTCSYFEKLYITIILRKRKKVKKKKKKKKNLLRGHLFT